MIGQKSVVHKESTINLICLEKENVHFKWINLQKCVIDVLKATKNPQGVKVLNKAGVKD